MGSLTKAVTLAILVLPAGPALAQSCLERITALEPRLNEASETTASVSSSGQGVAAARESQAMQSRTGAEPIAPATVPPFQSPTQEAATTRRAAEAGAGGDQVMQARAMLNEARSLDQRGDTAACLDKITQAERQLSSR